MGLAVHQTLQLLGGVFQLGGKKSLGQRVNAVTPVCHDIGVPNDHLIAILFPQIGKLIEHLIGGLEIKRKRLITILKPFGVQKDMPVKLILRLQKMNVSRGAYRLVQFLPQRHNGAVELPQLLFASHGAGRFYGRDEA